ncbi:helix-turn-helix domain-containing protein [Adhaeribacter soli]|uniref:Helix-turn-helix transcriptional regulator n=1 Tax=Adhaeribacter soli TaxID=2607655 RepID=A0A5N1IQY6_9BACT|nr:AraC family transcriptional regulator [Adhaeribacter soli]KAA9325980.1 helix-turn-helix transcriptional regulator [Adhaeribacter soli]
MGRIIKLELDYIRELQEQQMQRENALLPPEAGKLKLERIPGQHLNRVNLHEIKMADQELTFHTQSMPLVSIGFQLQGTDESWYAGVKEPMILAEKTFNVNFQPGISAKHTMRGENGFYFLHLGFTKERFLELTAFSPVLHEAYANVFLKNDFFLLWKNSPKISPALLNTVANLKQINFNSNLAGMVLEAALLNLIVQAHEGHFTEPSPSRENGILQEVKAYLEENYLADLSLKSLAKEFGTNEFSLKKGFREKYGHTVFGYIHQLRMEKAKDLLLAGKSIKAVAIEMGYEHSNHFSAAFTKWFGLRPSGFKK